MSIEIIDQHYKKIIGGIINYFSDSVGALHSGRRGRCAAAFSECPLTPAFPSSIDDHESPLHYWPPNTFLAVRYLVACLLGSVLLVLLAGYLAATLLARVCCGLSNG
jgi:hypothetical protein